MKKIGVIGSGNRAGNYMDILKSGLGIEWEVTAIADPSDASVEKFTESYGIKGFRRFESGPELIDAMDKNIDAVIIASPNALHKESLIPSLEKGYSILVEKPVVTTIDDCREVWKAYMKAGKPPVVVGFVLRYTVYFRKILELLQSGVLGKIHTIEAAENVIYYISAAFARSWRRFEKNAGPIILEKCSHDMDVINMLAGELPSKVTSFGRTDYYIPKPEAAMRCRDCTVSSTCRYNPLKIFSCFIETATELERAKGIYGAEDLCVFNSDKDVVDHQTVMMEYDNGILASFIVNMDSPDSERLIRINGSKGYLAGSLEKNELYAVLHEENGENVRKEKIYYPIVHDNSCHSGGDSVLSGYFASLLRGEEIQPLAGLKEGIDGCITAFAAEISRKEGKLADVRQLAEYVYG